MSSLSRTALDAARVHCGTQRAKKTAISARASSRQAVVPGIRRTQCAATSGSPSAGEDDLPEDVLGFLSGLGSSFAAADDAPAADVPKVEAKGDDSGFGAIILEGYEDEASVVVSAASDVPVPVNAEYDDIDEEEIVEDLTEEYLRGELDRGVLTERDDTEEEQEADDSVAASAGTSNLLSAVDAILDDRSAWADVDEDDDADELVQIIINDDGEGELVGFDEKGADATIGGGALEDISPGFQDSLTSLMQGIGVEVKPAKEEGVAEEVEAASKESESKDKEEAEEEDIFAEGVMERIAEEAVAKAEAMRPPRNEDGVDRAPAYLLEDLSAWKGQEDPEWKGKSSYEAKNPPVDFEDGWERLMALCFADMPGNAGLDIYAPMSSAEKRAVQFWARDRPEALWAIHPSVLEHFVQTYVALSPERKARNSLRRLQGSVINKADIDVGSGGAADFQDLMRLALQIRIVGCDSAERIAPGILLAAKSILGEILRIAHVPRPILQQNALDQYRRVMATVPGTDPAEDDVEALEARLAERITANGQQGQKKKKKTKTKKLAPNAPNAGRGEGETQASLARAQRQLAKERQADARAESADKKSPRGRVAENTPYAANAEAPRRVWTPYDEVKETEAPVAKAAAFEAKRSAYMTKLRQQAEIERERLAEKKARQEEEEWAPKPARGAYNPYGERGGARSAAGARRPPPISPRDGVRGGPFDPDTFDNKRGQKSRDDRGYARERDSYDDDNSGARGRDTYDDDRSYARGRDSYDDDRSYRRKRDSSNEDRSYVRGRDSHDDDRSYGRGRASSGDRAFMARNPDDRGRGRRGAPVDRSWGAQEDRGSGRSRPNDSGPGRRGAPADRSWGAREDRVRKFPRDGSPSRPSSPGGAREPREPREVGGGAPPAPLPDIITGETF